MIAVRSSSSAAWKRAAAAGLVCALIAGHGFEAAHRLLVRHAICAEHGELVESSGGAAEAHGSSHPVASSPPSSSAEGAQQWTPAAEWSAESDLHHHCLWLAQRTQAELRPPAAASPSAVFFALPPVGAFPGLDPPRSVAILHTAPKGSPPA